MRWIGRLDKFTDDLALKSKLLETLEDAYLAPVSSLSDRDLNAVKDQFLSDPGVPGPIYGSASLSLTIPLCKLN